MLLGRALVLLSVMGTMLTIAPWAIAAADQPHPSTTDKVVRNTKEAIEATKQYTIQQKEAFQKAVQAELTDVQTKIVELQKKTNAASVEARAEMQKAIQDLENKQDVRKKLGEVNESNSSAWSGLKAGMKAAVEDLKKSYQETVSKLP